MKNTAVTFSWIVGVVFLLVGILAYFTNPLVGEGALFHTDMSHDIVHLLSGVVAVICALSGEKASLMFLNVFGVVYLLVAVLGFVMIQGAETVSLLGLISVNAADNWLHLVLGVVILGLGLYAGKDESAMGAKM